MADDQQYGNFMSYGLAWTTVIGFVALTGILLLSPVSGTNSRTADMLFGAWISGFTQVLSYFFGSSKGSQDKTDLLNKKEDATAKVIEDKVQISEKL